MTTEQTNPPGPRDGGHGRRGPSWLLLVIAAAVALAVGVLGTLGVTYASDQQGAAPAATTPAPDDDEPTGGEGVEGTSADAPDWVALAEQVGPSVVAIYVQTRRGAGQGSGVIVSADGRIITNHHVVSGAVDGGLLVSLSDGRLSQASIVGTDVATDLAVIKIDEPPEGLQPAELGDSDQVRVGHHVAAIGNPLGLSNTVTTGIVSALDRPVTTIEEGRLPGEQRTAVTTNAIQVDAAVNPGNSGGPLFDAAGRVIGINSSIASMPTGAGGSAGSIGLGFAIPSNLVALITEQLATAGVAEHAFLGVGLTDAVVAEIGRAHD